jgi:hypothetical protein
MFVIILALFLFGVLWVIQEAWRAVIDSKNLVRFLITGEIRS